MVQYGLVDKNGGTGVPLQEIQVRGSLIGFTAEVTATMEYINNTDNSIEAIYVFPLDEEAAVCGFQATIDGRTIIAEVQEKQEARDTYDDAISSGHSAYLLEQSDESSDIFQINVGNLPPHKSATVQITFVTGLAVEREGKVVFVLPTVLNPRYTPSESQPSLSTTSTTIASVSTKYAFDFELDIHCASAIKEITSPSNRLQIDINPDDKQRAKVRLGEEYQFNADVQVHVLGCKPFEPHTLLEDCVTSGKEANDLMTKPVVMLNFFPEFHSAAALERGEFIFVVDRSGSMSGSRIKSARETLLLFLKSLPDDCHFNVVGFGFSFEMLFKKSEAYNDTTVDKACSHARSMEANLGGTEILAPLEAVFSQPLIKGYPRQVFLLTDGEVSNTQQVIDLTRRNADKARCFALGIGSGASTALIKGVARAGKGKAEFVISSDHMQAKVIKMLKNALQPALLDCELTWDLPEEYTAESVPNSLPAVFSGESLVLYGVLTLSKDKEVKKPLAGSVTLSATLSNGKQVTHKACFEGVSSESGGSKLLHRLAAKALIQAKQQQQYGLNRNGQEEEIITLSKAANVISTLTSFVAVDKDSHEPVTRPMLKISPELHSLQKHLQFAIDACAARSSVLCCTAPKKKSKSFLPSFGLFKGKKTEVIKKGRMKSAAPQLATKQLTNALCDYDPTIDDGKAEQYFGCEVDRSQTGPLKGKYLIDLVSLQKASGAWQLTDQLARICGVTKDKLKQTCPSQLTASNKESVWATALALACLFGKFKDRKDEWEMVATKGVKWLKKTIDDKVLSYEKVMEMAGNALGN